MPNEHTHTHTSTAHIFPVLGGLSHRHFIIPFVQRGRWSIIRRNMHLYFDQLISLSNSLFSRHTQIPDVHSEKLSIFAWAILMWSHIKCHALINMNSMYKLFIVSIMRMFVRQMFVMDSILNLNLLRISTLLSLLLFTRTLGKNVCVCVFKRGLCNSIDLLRFNSMRKKKLTTKKQ